LAVGPAPRMLFGAHLAHVERQADHLPAVVGELWLARCSAMAVRTWVSSVSLKGSPSSRSVAASAALTAEFAPEPAPEPIPEPPRVSAPMHTAGPMVSAPVTREVPGSYQYQPSSTR
jgi:hypothetical protein